jgi:hypothetical protein
MVFVHLEGRYICQKSLRNPDFQGIQKIQRDERDVTN